jgi:hypothetical protein
MGTAKWDPATSWASTLTAIAALLGVALSFSAALPTETQWIAKNQFAGLSVFFAAVNLLAPFIYNATRRVKSQGCWITEATMRSVIDETTRLGEERGSGPRGDRRS